MLPARRFGAQGRARLSHLPSLIAGLMRRTCAAGAGAVPHLEEIDATASTSRVGVKVFRLSYPPNAARPRPPRAADRQSRFCYVGTRRDKCSLCFWAKPALFFNPRCLDGCLLVMLRLYEVYSWRLPSSSPDAWRMRAPSASRPAALRRSGG